MPESVVRMMAASGMLGYGFTEEGFRAGLAREPDFIASDAGLDGPGAPTTSAPARRSSRAPPSSAISG